MNLPNMQATWVNSEQDSMLHRITNRIRRSLELQEILTATAAEIRCLLGTDRVKIYKFHPDQSSQVVAESIYKNRLPTLLGLNFPAGDIPPHARELFIKSRVRSVVDVDSQQIGHSHLQELEDGDTRSEDIRYRPVDPCHMEYLTAMGVMSSVVVPIFHHEQLWGLLVSHHSESRAIPDAELQLLQGVVNQLSIAIAQSEHLAQAREQAQREAALNRLNNFLHSLSTIELQTALEKAVVAFQGAGSRLCIKAAYELQDGTLRSFTDCLKSGSVQLYTYGVQPQLPELAKYKLMEQYSVWQEHYKSGEYDIWSVSDLYRTDALRNLQAAFYTARIRSLLMIPLQYRQQLFGYLSIFRDEFETETLWAGWVEEDHRQIYPQLSFEAWRDAGRAQKHEWSTSELELARSIGSQFSTAIYQYEIRQQLQTLNANLESQVQERTGKLIEAAGDIQKAAEQQRVLFDVVAKMRESLNLATIFQTTTQEVGRSLQIDRVSVYRFTLDQSEMKSVDIHEGIDSTLMILQHQLKANVDHSGVQVVKEYGDLPLIECYPGQLNQVFMNLLSNAIDAMEVRKARRAIQDLQANPSIVRIQTQLLDGDRIAIYITDNGIGMPEEIRHRIFDPFFTTKAIGKGTGLGLSISYQIVVEKHGGEIKGIAAPGQGTKFVIEIPTKQTALNP